MSGASESKPICGSRRCGGVRFEIASTRLRCLCRICDTPLGEPETNPRGVSIAAVALDDDRGVRLALRGHMAERHSPGLGGGPES